MVGRENKAAPIDPNMMLTRRVVQTQKAVSYIPLLGARYFDATPPLDIGLEIREFLAHDSRENRARMGSISQNLL
jgi:hypothetical protein